MLSVARRIFLIAGWCLLAGPGAFAQQQPAAAPPLVETAAVKLSSVTTKAEFVGSVVAAQQVALTARVEGFLDSVNFTEGSFVQADSTTFVIEKDTYQAAVDGARRSSKSAIAAEAGAEANLKLAGHHAGPAEGARQNQCRAAVVRRPGAGAARQPRPRRSTRRRPRSR